MATPLRITGEWAEVHALAPNSYRTLLYGPPGTGKTSSAYYAVDGSRVAPETVEVLECHDELMVAEALGHFVKVGERTIWFDGPVSSAMRHGKTLLIDEIDLASGALLSALRGILNDPAIVKLSLPRAELAFAAPEEIARMVSTGTHREYVRPAPGFRVVATMNGERDDLTTPLWDRFDHKRRITEIHPAALQRLPEWLRDFAREGAMTEDEEQRISVRPWIALTESFLPHHPAEVAFRAVFGSRGDDVLAALQSRIGGPIPAMAAPAAPTSVPSLPEPVPAAPAPTPMPAPEPTLQQKMTTAAVAGTPGMETHPAYVPPAPAVAPVMPPEPVPAAPTPGATVRSIEDARAARLPVMFRVKTGTAGRPPKPICPTCGNDKQGRMSAAPGAHLACDSCGATIYPAGGFTVKYKNPDESANKNRKWLDIPGF